MTFQTMTQAEAALSIILHDIRDPLNKAKNLPASVEVLEELIEILEEELDKADVALYGDDPTLDV